MNLYDPLRDSILLLILIILALFSYFMMMYLRGKRVTYFGNLKTLTRTHNFRIFHVSSVVLIVKILVIVLLYMIATNAIEIVTVQPMTDTDFILLLDVSSSMARTDYNPNRLASAKDIAGRWLNILPDNTMVGIASFSQFIEDSVPLTLDKKLIKNQISDLKINYSKSGTDLDYALNYAVDMFNDSVHKKNILLFTDGTDNIRNITLAKIIENNVSIYSFGIGSEELKMNLSEIPEEFREDYVSLDLNFTILEELSEATEGKAYRIGDEMELQESFREATLEQVEVSLNSSYYVAILIALISTLELIVYARYGAI